MYVCLWCIVGKVEDFPDVETARKVSIDYTLAAASAFATSLQPANGKKFAFVFCSGRGVEQDESKTLWLFPTTWKIKGAVEKGLLDIAEEHSSTFQSLVVRPGRIIPEERHTLYNVASHAIASVLVSDLAKVMVDLCFTDSNANIFENEDMIRKTRLV